MTPPLAIELFAGCFGGTAGWLQLGGRSVGFDIAHEPWHGPVPAGASLILQDVTTLHGSQFRDAAFIWASPPCQAYSYLAMPWSRSSDPENSKAAKALRKKWETEGPDNRLFDACSRIQRQAIRATCQCDCIACRGPRSGHCLECGYRYIPLIVENVRGAQPWVGKSKAQFGSFHLWGDVAQIGNRVIAGRDLADIRAGRGRFGMGVAPGDGVAQKQPGNSTARNWSDRPIQSLHDSSPEALAAIAPVKEYPLFQGKEYAMCRTGASGQKQLHTRGDNQTCGSHRMGLGAETDLAGTKIGGDWFRDPACHSKHGSRSNARKAASAMIARIPPALSRYVAEQFWPTS